jgi:hypothetical protein
MLDLERLRRSVEWVETQSLLAPGQGRVWDQSVWRAYSPRTGLWRMCQAGFIADDDGRGEWVTDNPADFRHDWLYAMSDENGATEDPMSGRYMVFCETRALNLLGLEQPTVMFSPNNDTPWDVRYCAERVAARHGETLERVA